MALLLLGCRPTADAPATDTVVMRSPILLNTGQFAGPVAFVRSLDSESVLVVRGAPPTHLTIVPRGRTPVDEVLPFALASMLFI